jgi:hypothetical protein
MRVWKDWVYDLKEVYVCIDVIRGVDYITIGEIFVLEILVILGLLKVMRNQSLSTHRASV